MFGLGKKKKKETSDVVTAEEEYKEYDRSSDVTYNGDAKNETKIEYTTSEETATTTNDSENTVIDIKVDESLQEKGIATTDQDDQKEAPLTWKEARALKKSKYFEKIATNPKFDKVFVLRNKKTGQIVEINAASSFHACKIIGWKPNKVKVIEEKKIELKKDETSEKAEERITESSSVLTDEINQELPPGLR